MEHAAGCSEESVKKHPRVHQIKNTRKFSFSRGHLPDTGTVSLRDSFNEADRFACLSDA